MAKAKTSAQQGLPTNRTGIDMTAGFDFSMPKKSEPVIETNIEIPQSVEERAREKKNVEPKKKKSAPPVKAKVETKERKKPGPKPKEEIILPDPSTLTIKEGCDLETLFFGRGKKSKNQRPLHKGFLLSRMADDCLTAISEETGKNRNDVLNMILEDIYQKQLQ